MQSTAIAALAFVIPRSPAAAGDEGSAVALLAPTELSPREPHSGRRATLSCSSHLSFHPEEPPRRPTRNLQLFFSPHLSCHPGERDAAFAVVLPTPTELSSRGARREGSAVALLAPDVMSSPPSGDGFAHRPANPLAPLHLFADSLLHLFLPSLPIISRKSLSL